jgi:hypothetical protein
MTYNFESVMNIFKMNKGKITKPFKCQKIATQIQNTNHIACALNCSMSTTGSCLFAYMNLLPRLQGTIGSNKCDAKLAKHFVCKKLSKKVQFLQMGNDELMKKVYLG